MRPILLLYATWLFAGQTEPHAQARVQASPLLARRAQAHAPQATAQQPAEKKDRYEFRKFHDPDGTGKFYLGREIAQVMTFHGASWLDRPEREREEAPSKLLPALKIKAGAVV